MKRNINLKIFVRKTAKIPQTMKTALTPLLGSMVLGNARLTFKGALSKPPSEVGWDLVARM